MAPSTSNQNLGGVVWIEVTSSTKSASHASLGMLQETAKPVHNKGYKPNDALHFVPPYGANA
eukprot:4314129-Amphidinium_carterae.2